MKSSAPPMFSKKILVMLLVIFAFMIALIPSFYFYNKYQQIKKSAQTNTLSGDEIKTLVGNVGSHITLPKDEDPTIATVSDKEKIKNQPFFAQAENGDKVLIYTEAKKAILYRPSIDRIIDVVPININPASKASPTQSEKVKITIYNGTTTSGLASKTSSKIKSKIQNAEITTGDAQRSDYTKTLVIDVNGNKGNIAKELAAIIPGTIEKLPEGEKKPEGDILIILGQ